MQSKRTLLKAVLAWPVAALANKGMASTSTTLQHLLEPQYSERTRALTAAEINAKPIPTLEEWRAMHGLER